MGGVFTEKVLGPHIPRVPRLCDLVEFLMRRRDASAEQREEEEVPELAEFPDDVEAYDPVVVEAAARIVAGSALAPVRLSELLAEAAGEGAEVAELVRLSVLWAFAPEHDDEEVMGIAIDILDSAVVAVATGDVLVTEGWTGDDLVIGPVDQLIAEDDATEEVG